MMLCPTDEFLEKNMNYLTILLNGLIKKLRHEPMLQESAGELQAEEREMMHLIQIMQERFKTCDDENDFNQLNCQVIRFINHIRESKLFKVVMTNTLDGDIKREAYLYKQFFDDEKAASKANESKKSKKAKKAKKAGLQKYLNDELIRVSKIFIKEKTEQIDENEVLIQKLEQDNEVLNKKLEEMPAEERKLWKKELEVKEQHYSEEVNKIIKINIKKELSAKEEIKQLTNEKTKIMDFVSHKINQINSEFRGECSKMEDSKEGKL